MVGCSRGILIAGVTNRARTQMAEGILRCLTANAVFIKSGGVHHEATVHPLAVKVMRDIGVDISGQSVSSLESARRQQNTYDVYVSIDCSYERRATDKTQRPAGGIQRRPEHVAGSCGGGDSHQHHDPDEEEEGGLCYDPLLVPGTPSHWGVGADATDVRRRWNIWSPRDPTIFHETSTRKFQDHLYEGEPLFMQLRPSVVRAGMKVSERWEVDEIASRYGLERLHEHETRFVRARDELLRRSVALLEKLERHYGERLLLDGKLLEKASVV